MQLSNALLGHIRTFFASVTCNDDIHPCPRIPIDVSLPQSLTLYNPDDVTGNKIIYEDDHTEKRLSYDELRRNASRGARGFLNALNVKECDVVGICALNSAWIFWTTNTPKGVELI